MSVDKISPDLSCDLFGELNRITNQELEDKINQHELWLTTHSRQGKRLKLFRYDLSKRTIKDRNLKEASFELCYFEGSQILNCDCQNSTFYRAYLSNGRCEQTNFNSANFISAVTQDAVFTSCSFETSIFMYGNFDGSQFHQGNFTKADFEHCSLKETRITKSVLDSAFLPISDPSNHSFKDCTANEKTKFFGSAILPDTNTGKLLVWKNGKFDHRSTDIENGLVVSDEATASSNKSQTVLGIWTSTRCDHYWTLNEEDQLKFVLWVEEEKENGKPHKTHLPDDL